MIPEVILPPGDMLPFRLLVRARLAATDNEGKQLASRRGVQVATGDVWLGYRDLTPITLVEGMLVRVGDRGPVRIKLKRREA